MSTRPQDVEAPVTIATYPNPHEAELARAALESQGVSATVQNDHGQYLSIAAWVQLQVALRDRELASRVLEKGPTGPCEDVNRAVAEAGDDMRPLRLKRRFTLARWFLFASTLWFLLNWVTGPLFLIPLGLALWSRTNPRRAFGSAFFVQMAVLFVFVAISGLAGLTVAIPLVAYYWAWTGATPEPPERLLASPIPKTATIEIGQAWREGTAELAPGEGPVWMLRVLGVFVIAVVIVKVLEQMLLLG